MTKRIEDLEREFKSFNQNFVDIESLRNELQNLLQPKVDEKLSKLFVSKVSFTCIEESGKNLVENFSDDLVVEEIN